jgi:hypothetical protein
MRTRAAQPLRGLYLRASCSLSRGGQAPGLQRESRLAGWLTFATATRPRPRSWCRQWPRCCTRADADKLIKDIAEHAAELELAQAKEEAAQLRRLLPGVIEAKRRPGKEQRELQGAVDALRARKEVLQATYMAAYSSVAVNEAIATVGLTGDDRGAEARLLRDVTAQIEREVGQQSWPEGLCSRRDRRCQRYRRRSFGARSQEDSGSGEPLHPHTRPWSSRAGG